MHPESILPASLIIRGFWAISLIVSRNLRGKEITITELADIFKKLEDMGAENINLVNPTHYLKDIMGAIEIYRPKIPIVYNTHG